jgi:hypothetical protein
LVFLAGWLILRCAGQALTVTMALIESKAPMNPSLAPEQYRVWASDHIIYGPVDLNTLSQWIVEGRVFAETWVHSQRRNAWHQAQELEALREAFAETTLVMARTTRAAPGNVVPEELRQFGLFAGLANEQLAQFLQFGELIECETGEVLIKRGEPSDALFLILAGGGRARLLVGYEEKTLGRMVAGECFGEVAMLTRLPRTADVVVENKARLLRLSAEACLLFAKDLPAIAAPFLFGIARMMAVRIAERNQDYQKELASDFLWR